MIDIHTHILPGVDDGSQDLENSLKSLHMMQNEGVTDVFLTPHFIPGEYDNYRTDIEVKCKNLSEEVKKAGLEIKLHCGIEYYLTQISDNKTTLDDFRLGESRYILVETAMNGFPHNLENILYQMVRQGYKPILAHPERYTDIIRKPSLAEDFVYKNIYLQVNAGSLLGIYGKNSAQIAWELLTRGLVHFVASDYHCRTVDYPLKKLVSFIKEERPEIEIDELVINNPQKILENGNVEYISSTLLRGDATVFSEGLFSKLKSFFRNG